MKHFTTLIGLTACAAAIGITYASHTPSGIPATALSPSASEATEAIEAKAAVAADTDSDTDTREWVEVTLETPGSLGVEILYKVDKLADVLHLRVTGTMNSDDWTTISNIASLQSLDLSSAVCTSVPASQFYNRKSLSDIILSPSVTSIGESAFRETALRTITIPAAVTGIGRDAFNHCSSLTEVKFEEGSRLTSLDRNAFYYCNALETVSLPDRVTDLPYGCFDQCNSLKNLTLPANLRNIGQYCFAYTYALKLVDFPESVSYIDEYAFYNSGLTEVKLPKRLSTIRRYAFQGCTAITDITLPARISVFEQSIFTSCSSLKNITCYAAIPPTNGSQAFSGCNMSQVSLHVPEFAVVNYKLDSFWLTAGSITGDVSSDYWQLDGPLTLTNNRRMEGAPDIDITTAGSLTVGGTAAMPMRTLTLNARYDYDTNRNSQIISSCPAITADNITLSSWFYSNRWHFISLPFDARMSDITVSPADTPYVIRYYDGAARAASGTGNSWKDLPADGTLLAGKGYIVMTSREATLSFHATADSHSLLFDPNARVTALESNPSDNAADAGWNLIGNPWQSYYDLYYSMLTSPVTVWNINASNYTAYSLIDDNLVLRPGQAFFVQADATLSEIEFGTQGRQLTSAVDRQAAPGAARQAAAAPGTRSLFNLTISCDDRADYTDATRVVLNPDASAEYESHCDAAKFFSPVAEVPAIYTIDACGEKLAINERPQTDERIPLGYVAPAAGRLTIRAGRIDGAATLHDSLTGTDTELTEGCEYTFDAAAAGADDTRFSLTLSRPFTTGVADTAAGSAAIASDGRTITVSGAARVEIYTADGTLVVAGTADAREAVYTLPSGIYIVRADDTLRKCLIRNF